MKPNMKIFEINLSKIFIVRENGSERLSDSKIFNYYFLN